MQRARHVAATRNKSRAMQKCMDNELSGRRHRRNQAEKSYVFFLIKSRKSTKLLKLNLLFEICDPLLLRINGILTHISLQEWRNTDAKCDGQNSGERLAKL